MAVVHTKISSPPLPNLTSHPPSPIASLDLHQKKNWHRSTDGQVAYREGSQTYFYLPLPGCLIIRGLENFRQKLNSHLSGILYLWIICIGSDFALSNSDVCDAVILRPGPRPPVLEAAGQMRPSFPLVMSLGHVPLAPIPWTGKKVCQMEV